MAKPIEFKPTPRDSRDELQRRLNEAPLQHADALLAGYDVLQRLQDTGTLDVVRGVLGAGNQVVEHVVSVVTQPESVNGLRNFIVMLKLLGEIDPELLQAVAKTVPSPEEQRPTGKPLSLFGLFRRMTCPETRTGLAVVVGALAALGKALEQRRH